MIPIICSNANVSGHKCAYFTTKVHNIIVIKTIIPYRSGLLYEGRLIITLEFNSYAPLWS